MVQNKIEGALGLGVGESCEIKGKGWTATVTLRDDGKISVDVRGMPGFTVSATTGDVREEIAFSIAQFQRGGCL
ncbi:hypothetical protein OAO01_02225 [Oligoflexia bacterium]|nr:hypothetical protein [Oligoflexia bacterium]